MMMRPAYQDVSRERETRNVYIPREYSEQLFYAGYPCSSENSILQIVYLDTPNIY